MRSRTFKRRIEDGVLPAWEEDAHFINDTLDVIDTVSDNDDDHSEEDYCVHENNEEKSENNTSRPQSRDANEGDVSGGSQVRGKAIISHAVAVESEQKTGNPVSGGTRTKTGGKKTKYVNNRNYGFSGVGHSMSNKRKPKGIVKRENKRKKLSEEEEKIKEERQKTKKQTAEEKKLAAINKKKKEEEDLKKKLEELEDDEWTQDPSGPEILEFTAEPGLKVTGERPKTPLDFFQLFVTRELLEYIAYETNLYAEYCKGNNFPKCKAPYDDVEMKDIANYIGLRILMTIIKVPEEKMHWETKKEYYTPTMPRTMPFKKYQQIGKYFHTFNREAIPNDNTDRLIHVRKVMDYIRTRCHKVYQPERKLSLDEGALGHYGWLAFKVYNPKKPKKYCIKFYMLCEASTGYVLDWLPYVGESQTLSETCEQLVERYFGGGYMLFMDNFYNSVELTDRFYEKGMHTNGTLRVDRKGTPPIIKYYAKIKDKKKMAQKRYCDISPKE